MPPQGAMDERPRPGTILGAPKAWNPGRGSRVTGDDESKAIRSARRATDLGQTPAGPPRAPLGLRQLRFRGQHTSDQLLVRVQLGRMAGHVRDSWELVEVRLRLDAGDPVRAQNGLEYRRLRGPSLDPTRSPPEHLVRDS